MRMRRGYPFRHFVAYNPISLASLKVKEKFAEGKEHLKLSGHANKLLLFNVLLTTFFHA